MAQDNKPESEIEQAFQQEFLRTVKGLDPEGSLDTKILAKATLRAGASGSPGVGALASKPVAKTVQNLILVLITVGEKQFAVPLSSLRNIVEVSTIAPVPFAPREIAGLVNLRGRVVTVLDMRLCIDMEKSKLDSDHFVLVTFETNNKEHYAFIVDHVGETIEMHPSTVKSPPKTLTKQVFTIAKGIIQVGPDLVILIEPERLIYSILAEDSSGMFLTASHVDPPQS